MELPLEGLKVVELAQSLGSPFCTSMMSDYGADVIKVEPRDGDRVRRLGTTYLNGESAIFFSLNRGKKDITLDIRKPEGQEIVKKLAKDADLVTENYRPGVLDKFGIGYDGLSKLNSRLIYLSITGFGAKGPWADRPGTEPVFQAYSGLMSARNEKGVPQPVSIAVSDMAAAVYAFMGVMLALYVRDHTGKGQRVDVSNLNSTLSMFSQSAQVSFFGGPPKDLPAVSAVPNGPYKTKDGYFLIASPNPQYWPNICKALGREDLITDPKFATNMERVRNKQECDAIIQDIVVQKTTAEWLKIFREADAMGGPINTFADLPKDPQLLANDMIVTVDHPIVGAMNMIGIPIKLSDTPGKIKGAPPVLGHDTNEVLQGLGYTEKQIEELKKAEVI
ncbi:MAG: CoA transferase [Chloroflexota bacterium]